MAGTGKNRIMIYGPKDDGTYVVEFRTAEGEVLAISIPRTEAAVVGTFRSECPTVCSCPMKQENRDDAEAEADASSTEAASTGARPCHRRLSR